MMEDLPYLNLCAGLMRMDRDTVEGHRIRVEFTTN